MARGGTPLELEATTTAALAEELRGLAEQAAARGGRVLLGLCGPPGSGKSTVAAALRRELGEERAVVVQQDGFHLASNVIAGTELAQRRGAIDTFDAASFAVLVERLRAAEEPVVYAPSFERELEEPINASVAVRASHDVVIVEGNYLLADGPDWARARACLDQVWFLHRDPEVRIPQLVDRHVRSGKSRADAEEWVARSDEANARLIAGTRDRADRLLEVRLTREPEHAAGGA